MIRNMETTFENEEHAQQALICHGLSATKSSLHGLEDLVRKHSVLKCVAVPLGGETKIGQ